MFWFYAITDDARASVWVEEFRDPPALAPTAAGCVVSCRNTFAEKASSITTAFASSLSAANLHLSFLTKKLRSPIFGIDP